MLWREKTAKIKGLVEKGKLGAKRECGADSFEENARAVDITGEGVGMGGLRTARSGDACRTQDGSKQQPR